MPLSPGAGGSAAVYNGQTYPQGTNNVVTFDATGRETKTVTTKYIFAAGRGRADRRSAYIALVGDDEPIDDRPAATTSRTTCARCSTQQR